jgi:hypothetical protein
MSLPIFDLIIDTSERQDWILISLTDLSLSLSCFASFRLLLQLWIISFLAMPTIIRHGLVRLKSVFRYSKKLRE